MYKKTQLIDHNNNIYYTGGKVSDMTIIDKNYLDNVISGFKKSYFYCDAFLLSIRRSQSCYLEGDIQLCNIVSCERLELNCTITQNLFLSNSLKEIVIHEDFKIAHGTSLTAPAGLFDLLVNQFFTKCLPTNVYFHY